VPMEWLRVDESTPLLGRKRKDVSRTSGLLRPALRRGVCRLDQFDIDLAALSPDLLVCKHGSPTVKGLRSKFRDFSKRTARA
jgi:hypothetical protein